jgi:lysophospholipid acyltransferase (LPLAT)-like uncharacterized protein
VTQTQDKLFRRGSLARFPWNKRLLIRLADLSFYSAVGILGALANFDVNGKEHVDHVLEAGQAPIFAFWHDQIMLATYFFRGKGVVVMTSKSFDGEYIARFITRFGYGAIRGSSSRGGTAALIQMIRAMRNGHPAAFTIDGPRGPRHVAKKGPLLLAKETGNPILPVTIEPKRSYRIGSWDRLQIPAPLTTSLIICGEPIYVAPDADQGQMKAKQTELQNSLDLLTEKAAKWRSL